MWQRRWRGSRPVSASRVARSLCRATQRTTIWNGSQPREGTSLRLSERCCAIVRFVRGLAALAVLTVSIPALLDGIGRCVAAETATAVAAGEAEAIGKTESYLA